MRRALEEKMLGIEKNASVDGALVVREIRRRLAMGEGEQLGYDVIGNESADMVEKGIIDPAKVTRRVSPQRYSPPRD